MANGVGTTHHVKIGDDFYLLRPGSYRQRGAPLFGPRFTTGDPDYNTLNFWQHWVQRCWIGGFDAPQWEDEAMYDKVVGVDSSYHEVLLLTRDMGQPGASNFDLSEETAGGHSRLFFTWKGTGTTEALYCLSFNSAPGADDSLLFRLVSGVWTLTHTFSRDCKSFAKFRNRVYFGTSTSSMTYMSGSPGSESFTTNLAKPSGVTATPNSMEAWRGQLYVEFAGDIWRLNKDNTWDGSTAFWEGTDITQFRRMEPHLGFLYLASENGHIVRTDGNNTFDLWSMQSGARITDIRSFDGRLFVAVSDPLEGTSASEAVLYQFSGSAVTELKRFGKVGVEMSLGRLRPIGGKMVFGASSLLGFGDGFGIGMYDPVEDSYHMLTTSRDTVTYAAGTEQSNWVVDDICYYRDYLYASVRGHGIFRTKYVVRDVERLLATYDTTASGAGAGSKNGGWLETSDFDAGTPGLRKLWNAIILNVDLPDDSCSVYVEYSLDGGQAWVEAGTVTRDTADRYEVELLLGGATGGVYGPTFKVRFTLRTTDSGFSPAIRGMSVRYLPVPEPTWQWDMTLVLSDRQELLDGTIEAPDNDTKLANLKTAFRDQSLVKFVDIDGTAWEANGDPGVLITALDVQLPFVGPTSDGALEYEVRVTLTEAVEDYDA